MTQARNRNSKLAINRLVIVSNRLPIAFTKVDSGKWQIQPGTGGLVTALAPLLGKRGGLWVGWPGTPEKADLDKPLAIASQDLGYIIEPVSLTKEEINEYYFGFSNEILWPLFHDLLTRCNFDPNYWSAYQAVNRKFAEVTSKNTKREDYIWVHDYHLMLVAKELHSIGVENKVGFFLHTPFPPLDIFLKLPWRTQILSALLEYDLVGFQTRRDRNNFVYCIESLLKGFQIDARKQVCTMITPKREIKIGSFPISIDFKDFSRRAASADVASVAKQVREAMPNQQIVLGVDRLDYSKGITEKLKAFRNALEHFKDLRGKITLIQIAIPSRRDVPEYQALRTEIERLVGEINGRFSKPEWTPVHYMFHTLDRTELLGYYRAADIALVTPVKDGMNLVAKEYCAANMGKSGVLILSEFAGAATQLRKASILVNPYDTEGMAEAIYRSYNMSIDERRWRMRRLRNAVAMRDVFWWVDSFLQAATTE
ncbi:trehalose-6-phosphate synthase [Chloroflexota bacterium]